MKKGIQNFFKEIGTSGCYVLCLIELAEKITGRTYNIVSVLDYAIQKKWIQENMYILRPDLFLNFLTHKEWNVRKEKATYCKTCNEYIVERWELVMDEEKKSHFRLPDWDGYLDSNVVKNGKKISLRVFKEF